MRHVLWWRDDTCVRRHTWLAAHISKPVYVMFADLCSLNWVLRLSPHSRDGEVYFPDGHEGTQVVSIFESSNLPQMLSSFSYSYLPFRYPCFLRASRLCILLGMLTVSVTVIASLGKDLDCLLIFKARHYQIIVENRSYRKSNNENRWESQ